MINESCVIHYVQVKYWGEEKPLYYKDTVCDHWQYNEVKYNTKKIQDMYDNEITFIGFDDKGSKADSKKRYKKPKKGKVRWLLIPLILIGLGAYIFQPKLSWKH